MSGEILCDGAASLANAAGAIFNVQTPGGIFLGLVESPGPTFTNAGIFNVQAGAGKVDTDDGLVFTNSGSVNVPSGTLDIEAESSSPFINDGTVNAQPGTLNIADTLPPPPGNAGSAIRPQVTDIFSSRQNKRGLIGITVIFDEALDSTVTADRALFDILGAVKNHHKTVYTKAVQIKGISFDSQIRVTINLAKP